MNTVSAVKFRILQLCREQQISVNKLCYLSGVSSSTVKNILYGNTLNPGIVTIKFLCDGLDIDLPTFFSGSLFENLEQEMK